MAYDRRWLIADLDRRLSADPCSQLGWLASELGIERHTIESVVHESKGKSFREYQKEKLLRKALLLLTEKTGKSIKQIAVALGYASSAPFSRFVKTRTGSTPTEIRENSVSLVLIRKNKWNS